MNPTASCAFCRIIAGTEAAAIVEQNELTLALVDLRQAVRGHILVITRAHHADLRELDGTTAAAVMHSVVRITRAVGQAFPNQGISVWNSIGAAAFQEVPHMHFHIHPRVVDDQLLRIYPQLPEHADLAQREEIAAALKQHL